jgi:hypothetical protein
MDVGRPLSVGQQSLWLLYRLEPDSPAYNDAGAGRLTPGPDVAALARAVRLLLQRHEILRSRFVEIDGLPTRIEEPRGTALEVRRVDGVDAATLLRAVNELAKQPFDLERTGPLRIVLLQRETDAVLVVVNHHIATDAASQWIIWRDLLDSYAAFAQGRHPELVPLTGSYHDHVIAEQRLLTAKREQLEQYWRGVCAGVEAAELPLDRPRPHRRSAPGATTSRRLSDDLVNGVHRTAAELGVTPFALLLGVFQSLIYRHTSQSSFLIGCPTTTRRQRRAIGVVGYFVNTLVIRADFEPRTTFAEATKRAAQQIMSGAAHVGFPYPLLQQLDAGRTRARRSAFFRIAVTMVSASRYGAALDDLADGKQVTSVGGLRMEVIDVPRLEGQADLNVEITRSTNSLTLVFRYDTGLFDEVTIVRLLDSYLRLVEAAVTDAAVPVTAVSVMSAAERAQMLAFGAGERAAHAHAREAHLTNAMGIAAI